MRLTFRVTTSGEQWAVQSPHIDFKKCWPNDADFDESEFRREIRAFDDLVMMGSKPGERCALRFASILLDQFDGWLADCNDDAKLKAAGKFNAIRATVNGRMKREKYGCVRVRIDPIVRPFAGKVYHALRVRVDRTDRGVPNIAEATRYCAMVVSFHLARDRPRPSGARPAALRARRRGARLRGGARPRVLRRAGAGKQRDARRVRAQRERILLALQVRLPALSGGAVRRCREPDGRGNAHESAAHGEKDGATQGREAEGKREGGKR